MTEHEDSCKRQYPKFAQAPPSTIPFPVAHGRRRGEYYIPNGII